MSNKKSRAKIEEVKEKHESELMRLEGVVGVAIGENKKAPCIMVYLKKKSPKVLESIPKEIDGFEVCTEETGEFNALAQ